MRITAHDNGTWRVGQVAGARVRFFAILKMVDQAQRHGRIEARHLRADVVTDHDLRCAIDVVRVAV